MMKKLTYYAIGHSYLCHGPFAGWQEESAWGMAASGPQKDYFHQLISLIRAHFEAEIEAKAENHAELERMGQEGLCEEALLACPSIQKIRGDIEKMQPDLITVYLNANIPSKTKEVCDLLFSTLFKTIAAAMPKGAIVACGYAENYCERVSPSIKKFAEEQGFFLADLSEIYQGEKRQNPYLAFAQYPDYSGAIEFRSHPGDLGHRRIAELFFRQIEGPLSAGFAKREAPLLEEEAALWERSAEKQKESGPKRKWQLDSFENLGGLSLGGFNPRIEEGALILGAEVETGVSIGGAPAIGDYSEFLAEVAVLGVKETYLTLSFATEEAEAEHRILIPGGSLQKIKLPLQKGEKILHFSIRPDAVDCLLKVKSIEFC